MKGSSPILHLVPNFLGPDGNTESLPADVIAQIHQLEYFVAERAKSARAFLKRIGHPTPLPQIHITEYHHKSDPSVFLEAVTPLRHGQSMGVISEAGNPCIADPGAQVVQWAHRHNIRVNPMVGPSSILLALIASGFNGQHFTFHGYFPIHAPERKKALNNMLSGLHAGYTQIFMETPYRNMKMLAYLMQNVPGNTALCIAANITQTDSYIRTAQLSEWKKRGFPEIHKVPAIFLLGNA